MQNNESRARKDAAYTAFSTVTKALGNPRRLELLDLLVQGPRAVESLANSASMPLASCSQHLQVLKRARVVATSRQGTTVVYRLVPGMAEILVRLRALAEQQSPDLREARAALHPEDATIEAWALARAIDAGEALVIDVRPRSEFAAGHLPGARSVPIEDLRTAAEPLPTDRLLVATCRGAFCTWADEAVKLLKDRGHRAVRYEGGPADWTLAGGQLETA